MKINGPTLYEMMLSAANALDNNKTAINNMNVFPVPDGDTGINMSLTLSAVKKLEDSYAGENVSELSKRSLLLFSALQEVTRALSYPSSSAVCPRHSQTLRRLTQRTLLAPSGEAQMRHTRQ